MDGPKYERIHPLTNNQYLLESLVDSKYGCYSILPHWMYVKFKLDIYISLPRKTLFWESTDRGPENRLNLERMSDIALYG